MQHNRRGGGEWPACYGRSGIDLPRPILIFVASKKNGPPAAAVAATISAADSNFCCCDGRLHPILIFVAQRRMARLQRLLRRQSSASDSILRCLERKWPACSVCCDDDLPRPTPFFVAAKKVVPPAASVATIIFHVRFNSSMRQRKMVPPADRSLTCPDLGLQSESR